MKVSVIIEAASKPKYLRPQNTPSSIQLGKETLLSNQIKIVTKKFNSPEIIVVSGYQSRKIKNCSDSGFKEVYNPNYHDTNTAFSVGLGLKKAKYRHSLIICGNSVFNEKMLDIDIRKEPLIFITDDCDDSIGCTFNDEFLENMFFGLPNKWSGLVYVCGPALKELEKICLSSKNFFFFEAINKLNDIYKIKVVKPKKSKVVLVETNKDIELAKKIK